MQGTERVDQAIEMLEKEAADLEPQLLAAPAARARMRRYARLRNLLDYCVTAVSPRLSSAEEVARTTGTSLPKAKEVVATGRVMAKSDELASEMQYGHISLDQAATIAPAVAVAPGSAGDLLKVAQHEGFHVLRDRSKAVKLAAEQHGDLFERQRKARSARTYIDELGMGHIHLCLPPRPFAAISARAEAEAARLARAGKKATKQAAARGREPQAPEPFERYLADAFVTMLSAPGTVKGRSKRPDTVLLGSEGVPATGWTRVEPGEICKIPGVGPIPAHEAKEIARDSIVNVVLTDGIELKHFKRWSRSVPTELQVLLELGEPPEFDGVKCIDCGNRFRTEFDHVEPHVAKGAMSNDNIKPRCYPCHQAKTERDRKAGKLRRTPDDPDPPEP